MSPTEPPVGTLRYTAGTNDEDPRLPQGPCVTTFVYCGRVQDAGAEFHLLVEYTRWGTLRMLGRSVEPKDGVKYLLLEDLLRSTLTWPEVHEWILRTSGSGSPSGD